MESIEDIINRCKTSGVSKGVFKKNGSFKNGMTKILLSVIFTFCILIYVKIDDGNAVYLKDNLFANSLSFTKFNNFYTDNFGGVQPYSQEDALVFNDANVFLNYDDYLDGEKIILGTGAIVSSLIGGVVVYVGEKEGYNNTVIIQGNDGYDIWYGNLENVGIKLYDYIETGAIIGDVSDDSLYLKVTKDGKIIKYETYKN